MKAIIYHTLNEIGVPFGTLGRDYLESAVEFILERGRMAVTKELYPLVARAFATKPTSVERAIRHAAETTLYNGPLQQIQDVFGNAISFESGKLTNSEFIYGIVKYIQVFKLTIKEE